MGLQGLRGIVSSTGPAGLRVPFGQQGDPGQVDTGLTRPQQEQATGSK